MRVNKQRTLENFKRKVIAEFKDIIKSMVVVGSYARDEIKPKSNIDVFLIIDETRLEEKYKDLPSIEREKKMDEEREKLDKRIEKIAEETSKVKIDAEEITLISAQPAYTLSEFWNYVRVGHPIVYNFIKEGIPLYDTGFFTPIKRLLEQGKIPLTREAIDSCMEDGMRRLTRVKGVKLLMVSEDCYYIMLNSAQALLMALGHEPPAPVKAYEMIEKVLVRKGWLEQEYAEWLKSIVEFRKKVEHGEVKEIKGAELDLWLERAGKFYEKMVTLLSVVEIWKRGKIVERTHEIMKKALKDFLTAMKIGFKEEELFEALKGLIKRGNLDPCYEQVWLKVEAMFKLVQEGKTQELDDKEVLETREHVRRFIGDLRKVELKRRK